MIAHPSASQVAKIWAFIGHICCLVAMLLLGLGSGALPAIAAPTGIRYTDQYTPPPSYSNADLVGQDFSGQTLRIAEFSNANLNSTNFAHADLTGAVLSASTLTDANLQGANLTQAMLDQVKFLRTNLSDAVLVNAILLRSQFYGINITGTDFTDAIMDGAQTKQLCQLASGTNSQTGVETRASLGCGS